MDASQITKLRQKQLTQYVDRSKPVDSSTMIWMNQIQSSKYIKGVATCSGPAQTSVPTEPVCPNGNGTFSFGGAGKQMTLTTGSTQMYPSIYRGALGSASETYSSDKILLQKAGRNYCTELITDQSAYLTVSSCFSTSTNGPLPTQATIPVNNMANPYLPPFDTYYQLKNKCFPVLDENKKHHVSSCCFK